MTYGNCCGPTLVARRYYTNAERIAWLEGYAQELENELKAVKERIAALGGAEKGA